jgi:hypothetical protein
VVTKPFESQSLIHKVEELIHQSNNNAPAAEPEPQQPAALFAEPAPEPVAEPFAHDNDIFSAAPGSAPTMATEMPFDAPSNAAFGGETRAFPRMSFEEMQKMANEPATAPPPAMPEAEASPWDETPAGFGDETHSLPTASFDEAPPAPEASSSQAEASPWDEQDDGSATRAMPAMSFEEMRQMAEAAQPEATPFEAPPAAPADLAAPEASPWDEQPAAFGGETRAFPRMSFEEMQQMAAAPATAPEPAWNATPDPFAEASHAESPFAAEEPQQTAAEEPAWSMPEPTAEEPAPQPAAAEAAASPTGELTDEQVDRIARRVVQLMSDQVVRNIAWEVIPDLAEMVVKERIRELETEA